MNGNNGTLSNKEQDKQKEHAITLDRSYEHFQNSATAVMNMILQYRLFIHLGYTTAYGYLESKGIPADYLKCAGFKNDGGDK